MKKSSKFSHDATQMVSRNFVNRNMYIFFFFFFLLIPSVSYKIFYFLYSILSKGWVQIRLHDAFINNATKNIDCRVLIYEKRYLHYVEKYVLLVLSLIRDESRH